MRRLVMPSPTAQPVMIVVALVLALTFAQGAAAALAQAELPQPGAVLRVANTDGARLNLRSGPSTDQPVVARLAVGETLTVTAVGQTVGAVRWVPVRTSGGQAGWVSAQFVAVVSTPVPIPTRAPDPTPPATASASGVTEPTLLEAPKGRPVLVEAKLKYPEVRGRDQEITIWVTRDGTPVPGATVTVETRDGDEGEPFRELTPTNEEGRTRRVFDVRHEKGTVELQVEAVAPDGGEGRTIVTYFRR
jgi:uncharacterized protein YraI